MTCKNCNDTMRYISGNQNGGYYICSKCNNLVVTGGAGEPREENCCGGNGPNCKCK